MVLSCSAFGCRHRFVKGGPITFHSFPKDEAIRKLWVLKIRRSNFKATKYSRLCSKHFTDDCFNREKFGGTWLKPDAVPTIFDFPKHRILKKCVHKSPKDNIVAENFQLQSRCEVKSDLGNVNIISHERSVPVTNSETPICVAIPETPVSLAKSESPICVAISETPVSVANSETSVSMVTQDDRNEKYYRYIEDFSENDMLNPSRARRFLFIAKKQTKLQRRKIKLLREKIRRVAKGVSLHFMLHKLRNQWHN